MEEQKKEDYLKKVFDAIDEANAELNKFGVQLHWRFELTHAPVEKSFAQNDRAVSQKED